MQNMHLLATGHSSTLRLHLQNALNASVFIAELTLLAVTCPIMPPSITNLLIIVLF